QVSAGKPDITQIQATAPSGATNQYNGTLNGRSICGSVMRRIGIPTQTTTNAKSVPIDTNSPTKLSGIKPAQIETKIPVTMVALCGVWYFGCNWKNHGSKPSRAIE